LRRANASGTPTPIAGRDATGTVNLEIGKTSRFLTRARYNIGEARVESL